MRALITGGRVTHGCPTRGEAPDIFQAYDYGCIFVLITPTDAVLVAQIVLIVSEDGETAFAALCFVVG